MPFRRLWLNLTRSFGTILRRGRMATVYPAGVVGRHLLSVVGTRGRCPPWLRSRCEGVFEGLRQASQREAVPDTFKLRRNWYMLHTMHLYHTGTTPPHIGIGRVLFPHPLAVLELEGEPLNDESPLVMMVLY